MRWKRNIITTEAKNVPTVQELHAAITLAFAKNSRDQIKRPVESLNGNNA